MEQEHTVDHDGNLMEGVVNTSRPRLALDQGAQSSADRKIDETDQLAARLSIYSGNERHLEHQRRMNLLYSLSEASFQRLTESLVEAEDQIVPEKPRSNGFVSRSPYGMNLA